MFGIGTGSGKPGWVQPGNDTGRSDLLFPQELLVTVHPVVHDVALGERSASQSVACALKIGRTMA